MWFRAGLWYLASVSGLWVLRCYTCACSQGACNHLDVRVMDAYVLSFPDSSLDIIILFEVLYSNGSQIMSI